jgi:hypothetical protein
LAACWLPATGCAVINVGPASSLAVIQQQATAFRWLLFGAAILVPAGAWLGWTWSRRRFGVRSCVLLLACESAALAGAASLWKHFERQAQTAAASSLWVAVSSGAPGATFQSYVVLPSTPAPGAAVGEARADGDSEE